MHVDPGLRPGASLQVYLSLPCRLSLRSTCVYQVEGRHFSPQTITRVRAYGEKWRLWCVRNKYTSLKCIIPVDKRNRTVIDQDMLGDYSIAPDLLSEFQKVCAARVQAPPAQRPQVPQTRNPQRPRPRPEQRTAVQHEPVVPLRHTTQLTLQQAFGQAPST